MDLYLGVYTKDLVWVIQHNTLGMRGRWNAINMYSDDYLNIPPALHGNLVPLAWIVKRTTQPLTIQKSLLWQRGNEYDTPFRLPPSPEPQAAWDRLQHPHDFDKDKQPAMS